MLGGRHICADTGPADVSPSSANSVTTLSRPPPKGMRLLVNGLARLYCGLLGGGMASVRAGFG